MEKDDVIKQWQNIYDAKDEAENTNEVVGKAGLDTLQLILNEYKDITEIKEAADSAKSEASEALIKLNSKVEAADFELHLMDAYAHPEIQDKIPTLLSQLVDDNIHRTVTDTEKENWSRKIDSAQRGIAGGVATLDINSKIPVSQIPDTVLGQVEYIGIWDATTGEALDDLREPAGRDYRKGDFYINDVEGNKLPDDSIFENPIRVGDWVIYSGVKWGVIINSDAVAIVNGKTGVVVLNSGDILLTGYVKTEVLNTDLQPADTISTAFNKIENALDIIRNSVPNLDLQNVHMYRGNIPDAAEDTSTFYKTKLERGYYLVGNGRLPNQPGVGILEVVKATAAYISLRFFITIGSNPGDVFYKKIWVNSMTEWRKLAFDSEWVKCEITLLGSGDYPFQNDSDLYYKFNGRKIEFKGYLSGVAPPNVVINITNFPTTIPVTKRSGYYISVPTQDGDKPKTMLFMLTWHSSIVLRLAPVLTGLVNENWMENGRPNFDQLSINF